LIFFCGENICIELQSLNYRKLGRVCIIGWYGN